MKILHFIHKPQNRGAETFACQLAHHQIQLGHEVRILAIYPGNAKLNWKEPIKNLQGEERKFFDWKAWKNLASEVKNFQPDVVQANSGDTLKYAVFSKKVYGWNNPILFRNASEVGRYIKSFVQKQVNGFLYKNVSGVASVSEASEKDIIKHFPFLKNKTKVIPVGLEEKQPKSIQLEPKGRKHILHVGGFSFEKNHTGLISIFKKVLKAKPEAHLHLVGDGKLKPEIEALVKQQDLQKNVSFYGYVDNPLDFINAADVLVLPSIIEGLPGVLLEAMYCKTPVVAYNVGGIGEIVTSETGNLIKKADEEQFSEAVIKLLEQQNSTQTENAWQMVNNHFMNKKLAIEFEDFYKKIAK